MGTKIVLHGEPRSTSHIYHYHCKFGRPASYMTAEGRKLKEQYQWEAKSQWKGKPLEGDIEVSITLYFGTKRKADLDNFNKISLDALTGIVWEDDSQVADLRLRRAYDKERPRIELSISKL